MASTTQIGNVISFGHYRATGEVVRCTPEMLSADAADVPGEVAGPDTGTVPHDSRVDTLYLHEESLDVVLEQRMVADTTVVDQMLAAKQVIGRHMQELYGGEALPQLYQGIFGELHDATARDDSIARRQYADFAGDDAIDAVVHAVIEDNSLKQVIDPVVLALKDACILYYRLGNRGKDGSMQRKLWVARLTQIHDHVQQRIWERSG